MWNMGIIEKNIGKLVNNFRSKMCLFNQIYWIFLIFPDILKKPNELHSWVLLP